MSPSFHFRPPSQEDLTSSQLDIMLMPMTTTSPSLLDRTFHWILDVDGDMYGDEQERLRWYEATAAVSSVQLYGISLALAVLVWVDGHRLAPAVLTVALTLYLPMLLTNAYAHRHRVRTVPTHWSSKQIALTGVFLLIYLVMTVGLYVAFEEEVTTSGALGVTTGVTIGLALGITFWSRVRRREQAHENSPEDDPGDDPEDNDQDDGGSGTR